MWNRGIKETLTIASAATESGVLTIPSAKLSARMLAIYGPAALTGTVTLQVSGDGGVTFVALQSDGADITIPAAKCTVVTIPLALCDAIRLSSGSAEGADRDFVVIVAEELP